MIALHLKIDTESKILLENVLCSFWQLKIVAIWVGTKTAAAECAERVQFAWKISKNLKAASKKQTKSVR